MQQTIRLLALILAILPMLTPHSASADPVSLLDNKLVVNGEMRFRGEATNGYTPLTGGDDADIIGLMRTRLGVKATPNEHVVLFIQPQFSRTFGQEGTTIANGTAIDDLDLHQGYIDWLNISDSPISLRVGRQELVYGKQRLIGAFGWNNTGRNFDAVKLTGDWEAYTGDLFASQIARAGANEYLGGFYGTFKHFPHGKSDQYIIVHRDNNGSAAGSGLSVYTIGGRIETAFNQVDLETEAALQLGKSNPNTIFAFATHAQAGYTFSPTSKPRIGLEYNFASGDDPATSKVERFYNLFPTNHDKYGYIDFIGWRNIHDLSANFSLSPFTRTKCEIGYHIFLVPEVTDGLYRASGAPLRAGAANASHFAGHEGDLLVSYKANDYLAFLAGYSLFVGSDFFKDTGTNGKAHFGYLQMTASF